MGLISKTAMMGINGNVKYLEELGYEIPRRKNKWGALTCPSGAKIEVKVEHLKPSSTAIIEYECDNCKEIFYTRYADYTRHNHEGICYCRKCSTKIFNSGENSHLWKSDITKEERENKRFYPEYREFIKRVLNRDNFTCYCCGEKEGRMEVHHLDGYDWCKEKRTDETNGITLCKNCHKNFHSNYGMGNNTKEQFEEWIGHTLEELKKYDGKLPTAKKIYCLEEDKIYNSADEFSILKEVHSRSVYSRCNHSEKINSIKGMHIIWLNEYESMTSEEKENWIEKCKIKPKKCVVCLNTKEIFNSIVEANNKYNNAKTIGGNCRGKNKSSGILNNEKLVWRFYEDYLKMSQEEIDECIAEANVTSISGGKRVICITTGKVFNSANSGGRYYGLKTYSDVSYACNGKKNSCGKLEDGTKLTWKYIEDLTEEEYIKYDIENKLKKLVKEMV